MVPYQWPSRRIPFIVPISEKGLVEIPIKCEHISSKQIEFGF